MTLDLYKCCVELCFVSILCGTLVEQIVSQKAHVSIMKPFLSNTCVCLQKENTFLILKMLPVLI